MELLSFASFNYYVLVVLPCLVVVRSCNVLVLVVLVASVVLLVHVVIISVIMMGFMDPPDLQTNPPQTIFTTRLRTCLSNTHVLADHCRPKSKHPHFLPFKPTDHRRPLIRQPCSFKWADQRRPKHDNLQSCLSNGQTIADQSQNILISFHSNPQTIADP